MTSENIFETDTFETTAGPLAITFIGHGSLMLKWKGMILHVDPFGRQADYSQLPRADIILLTHEHGDHMDMSVLNKIVTTDTRMIYTRKCEQQTPGGIVMKNGDKMVIRDIDVEAVPAYNRIHARENGEVYHPRGEGNGYVLTFADLRIYIAGDTEDIPEMSELTNIDIAFLPMNLPYTMTPEMATRAALSFKPRILYPYHYGSTTTSKLVKLLGAEKGMEVRIRKMK